MSRYVFILGAGASRHAGGPLMNDFLDRAKDLWSSSEVSSNNEHFERVFLAISKLQSVHSKSELDINNIESIFSTFEIANVLQKFPSMDSTEIEACISSLKKVIASTLETSIPFSYSGRSLLPSSEYRIMAEMCSRATDLSGSNEISIITFNYDIALDFALYSVALNPDYSLDKPPTRRMVPLLKLHGSLNWARAANDSRDVVPLHLTHYFHAYSVSLIHMGERSAIRIPISSQLKEFFSQHRKITVEDDPVIVPPTWNKVEYHKILSRVWSRAAKELGEAEYIFVIGYSLPETDGFFRLLYALGTAGGTMLRQFAVFDPDPSGNVRRRFESLLGPGARARFRYDQVDMGGALRQIDGILPKRA